MLPYFCDIAINGKRWLTAFEMLLWPCSYRPPRHLCQNKIQIVDSRNKRGVGGKHKKMHSSWDRCATAYVLTRHYLKNMPSLLNTKLGISVMSYIQVKTLH